MWRGRGGEGRGTNSMNKEQKVITKMCLERNVKRRKIQSGKKRCVRRRGEAV